MIIANDWMTELTEKLKSYFGDKLILTGLQGSYQRDEATENSDIDAVIILDALSLGDLKTVKGVLATMPENDKTCGFISGRNELRNWPKHELFQFMNDTRLYYGSFDGLLPEIRRDDVIESVKIGASGLYHACCHTFLHGEPQALKALYKGAFFILQATYYLRHGEYVRSKKELLPLLTETEREILSVSMSWNEHQKKIIADSDEYFSLIISWCSEILSEIF